MYVEQSHLDYIDTINYGSYYTPEKCVDLVYQILLRNVPDVNNYIIADTSCGYGNFLRYPNSIGADIDVLAVKMAHNGTNNKILCHNSLLNVSRLQYGLSSDSKLIIIGNPPYNDTTSIIRNELKQEICTIDPELKHRDLGISFLLSYNKLDADYICVLHPLSYLIKKANFEGLGNFKNNYKLIDSVVISSGEFSNTSKSTRFPIVIALYKRERNGMTYDFIKNYKFRTVDGKAFNLNQFDTLGNYITKYPNQRYVSTNESVAFFYTMRDVNALKRTKTFMEKEIYNTIRVQKDKLAYYCYADVFKEFIPHIPYYFGNSDIMINHSAFERIKHCFIAKSLNKYNFLHGLLDETGLKTNYDFLIQDYFKDLLGEHYVDKNC